MGLISRHLGSLSLVLGILLLAGCQSSTAEPPPDTASSDTTSPDSASPESASEAETDEEQVTNRITSGPALDSSVKAVDESNERARLILGQDLLRGRIKIENPRFRKIGKFTQTAVQVINQTENRFELEYQLVWRDDDDFEVSSSAWKRFTLAGYEQEAIQAIANRPEASKITVTVRLPDQVVQ